MKRQRNPFDNFLFSVPGERGKYTYDEMKSVKNIKTKDVEVIDLVAKKSLGRMNGLAALLKFE
jgi:hypothetical protein